MQFPDGRVSHKLTRTTFSGKRTMPTEDQEELLRAPGHRRHDRLRRGRRQGRVFQPFDPEYAAKCTKAAELALAATRSGVEARPDLSGFRNWALTPSHRRAIGCGRRQSCGRRRVIRALRTDSALTSDNLAVDVDWDWGEGKNLGGHVDPGPSSASGTLASPASLKADLIRGRRPRRGQSRRSRVRSGSAVLLLGLQRKPGPPGLQPAARSSADGGEALPRRPGGPARLPLRPQSLQPDRS